MWLKIKGAPEPRDAATRSAVCRLDSSRTEEKNSDREHQSCPGNNNWNA